jgi:MerR family transcriptional regulator/heat shock protein HspR
VTESLAPAGPSPPGPGGALRKADDNDYPAYSMGAAAGLIGVEPAFLRALGRSGLLDPQRSEGGHRRYSRNEISLAARAREVVDEGVTMAAACRIVALEYQLQQAQAALAILQRRLDGRATVDGFVGS